MPIKLPKGIHISVARRSLPGDYRMPSMEMATDHYSIGFCISGDRRIITPLQSYVYHAGEVSMLPPYVYHRSVADSGVPYESYLIKFSPDFIAPFEERIGRNILEELYEWKVCRFSERADEEIERQFEDMLREYEKEVPYKEEILQGMLFRLLTSVWEERIGGGAEYFPSHLSEQIVDAVYKMEQDYAEDLTLEGIAREAGFSASYFSRLFRAQLGNSFSEYLSNVRIRHVQALLTETDRTVMEIALETGYCNGDYLSTQFKAKVGMTPSAFRKQARRQGGSETKAR